MAKSSLRRAILLMTASSALVPIIGVLSAPLLTNGLGVEGRGELAVATAPNLLLASIATLGLPEALTFSLARNPRIARKALSRSALSTVALSLIGLGLIALLSEFLSDGDPTLAFYILVGAVIAVPSLLLSLVRGAAAGLQMWTAIAAERVISVLLRLALLVAFVLSGQLTVLTAVIITTAGPLVGAVAYLRLARVGRSLPPNGQVLPPSEIWDMFGYGTRVWFGAVAGILLSRLSQLMFAPIGTVDELGLFVVAVTVSDVPLITSLAVRDALFGVNSRYQDPWQLATTCRRTLLVGLITGVALGGTLPFWVAPIFGAGFAAAVVPTEIMLISAIANIPAFLIAAGMAAWGRPGARSLGLVMTLVVNFGLFLLLVPPLGATGAAIAGAVSSIVAAVYMTVRGRSIIGVSIRHMVLPTGEDAKALLGLLGAILRKTPLKRRAR